MKRTLVYLYFISLSIVLWAVPAANKPICVTLADGTSTELLLCGDEYFHYHTLLDGTPVQLVDDSLVYLSSDYLSLQRRRSPALTRLNSSFPAKGNVKALVILIEYADLPFVTPNPTQAFTDLLNKQGYSFNGATGSVKDYFSESSLNQFVPSFDVYGPYKASREMAYYGQNVGSNTSYNVHTLIREACQLAEKNGVDFSQYDNNGDGVLDNLFVFYAGHNEAEGGSENTIWPHRHNLSSTLSIGGVKVSSYMCTSELQGARGEMMAGIGTFCHEFGHVIGLPDLYHTKDQDIYTVGTWDLMCSGSYNNDGRTPPSLSAFERFMLGWLTPEQLTELDHYRIQPLLTSNTAYLVAAESHNLSANSPSPIEYFLIENRQRVGWDAGKEALPGTGLLISHITFSADAWNYNRFNNGTILGYDIVEAFNKHPKQSTSTDTYPGSANITSMTPMLNNKELLHNYMLSNIFELPDLSVNFRFGPSDGTGFFFSPETLPVLKTTYDRKIVQYNPVPLTIQGNSLVDTLVQISTDNAAFEFSPDSGNTWYGGSTLYVDTVIDSTYLHTFLLRYVPSRQNCKEDGSVLNIRTASEGENVQMNQLLLTGYAPRPTYIKPPTGLEVEAVTPTSFEVKWQDEEDAEFYYVTLYTMEDKVMQMDQGFEDFASLEDVIQAGWSMTELKLSSVDRNDGRYSLVLSEVGQYVQTEIYKTPVVEISFYLSNTFAPAGRGVLTVEAKKHAGDWILVDNISMQSITNRICTYTFPLDSAFVQFRLIYTQQDGDGGVLIDSWKATMNKKVNYIHQGQELMLYAPMNTIQFTNLEWNETYYFQIQAYEEKGCEPHMTALTEPLPITTTIPLEDRTDQSRVYGATQENQLTVVKVDDSRCVLFLSKYAKAGDRVHIYNLSGQLLSVVDVPKGTLRVEIAAKNFSSGEMYILKYIPASSRLKRKQLWSKFIW